MANSCKTNVPLLVRFLLRFCTPYEHLEGYMERYWLFRLGKLPQTDPAASPQYWLSVRLHHILRSDLDQDMHDHPWSFITLILSGGYWEERPFTQRIWPIPLNLKYFNSQGQTREIEWHRPGSLLLRRAGQPHRVILPEGKTTWTLFIHKRKTQEWGFHTSKGWVGWRKYVGLE